MLTRLRRFLGRVVGGDGSGSDDASGDDGTGPDRETEPEDDGGFAGSLLDWSVNRGHGDTSGAEANRELAQVREQAETLSDEDRRRR